MLAKWRRGPGLAHTLSKNTKGMLMRTLKQILILCLAGLAVAACGKKKNQGAAPAQPTLSFYLSNNICYDANTNQQVNSSECSDIDYSFYGTSCRNVDNQQSTDMNYCLNTVGRYYFYNNSCWDKTTDTAVNNSHCVSSGNTGGGSGTGGSASRYQFYNYVCIDTQTGWVADRSNCFNGGSTTSCVGEYIYTRYDGYSYPVQCNGADCRGYQLYDPRTRQHVTCR